MKAQNGGARSLLEMELEVLEEGREWMRQRLEQKLQEEANRQGGVFPPERAKGSPPSEAVDEPAQRDRSPELEVWHGQDPWDRHWGCPIREQWQLTAHQQISPALEERLAFTATLAHSYEAAAQIASKWGSPSDDSVIHALMQRVGGKAEGQTRKRLKQVPEDRQSQRRGSELALLMVDGWYARFPGWGRKRTSKERVEWHEVKNGVFYLQEQAAQTAGGRRLITDKVLVRTLGDASELGERLHWEALTGGLGKAKTKLVLGDGIAWIWNLKNHRWPEALELLDFWHAGQHLWNLGRAIHGMEDAKARPWVEKRLHRLRHARSRRVLDEIATIKGSRSQTGQIVEKEKNYFFGQRHRMDYKQMADRGWPIGSGPVESSCRQDQCRFKRPGQSWTTDGFKNLSALDQARRNNHWDELWATA